MNGRGDTALRPATLSLKKKEMAMEYKEKSAVNAAYPIGSKNGEAFAPRNP